MMRLKHKWHWLLERLKLKENDYLNMKHQSDLYEKMTSAIEISITQNSKDITNSAGDVLSREFFDKNIIINIDTKEMLRKMGFVFDENAIWNVK